MNVTLIGKQLSSYTSKKTGLPVEGISLFATSDRRGVEGKIGYSYWIRKESELYEQVKSLDLSKPIHANIVNEVLPGGMFPEITEFTIPKQ